MKKFSVLLTLAVLMVSSSVFAGSIDYLSNQSAKYCMNTAATARTDGADIVAYNPAGTALMGEGFFIDVSNQTLLKYYSQDVSVETITGTVLTAEQKYEQDKPTILLPNVYLAYNFGQMGMGKLAVYGQMGVVAGGGALEWDGTAGTVAAAYSVASSVTTAAGGATGVTGISAKVEASSVYYAFGGGASYSFLDDMVSISAGAKVVMPERSAKLSGVISEVNTGAAGAFTVTIDSEYEYDATGYTPVFGLDLKPMKELTIGVRYEMETELEMEYKDKTQSVVATTAIGGLNTVLQNGLTNQLSKDGLKDKQNLPQILSIGAEYNVIPELTIGLTGTAFFIGDAKYEMTTNTVSSTTGAKTGTSTVDYADYFDTGWEVALGATYKVMEPLKVSASVMYTDQGAKDEINESTSTLNTVSANPVLNSIFVGLGATYTVIPNLDLTFAASWVHYLPEEADVALNATGTVIEKVSYKKDVYNIALGASYKI